MATNSKVGGNASTAVPLRGGIQINSNVHQGFGSTPVTGQLEEISGLSIDLLPVDVDDITGGVPDLEPDNEPPVVN